MQHAITGPALLDQPRDEEKPQQTNDCQADDLPCAFHLHTRCWRLACADSSEVFAGAETAAVRKSQRPSIIRVRPTQLGTRAFANASRSRGLGRRKCA